jgi:hypothetical protein
MVSIAAQLPPVQFVSEATKVMMRRTFSLTIALGWAACFIVQAALAPQHPSLGMEGAGVVAAAFAALASVAVAGLFLWLVTCLLSVRDSDVLMPFADWVRAAFGAAALVAICGIVAVLPTVHSHLAAVGFLQLTALLASYMVMARDADLRARPRAVNDNVPLGTRLLAWSAAQESMSHRLPAARAIMRGDRG